MSTLPINSNEFDAFRAYIEKHCAISLEPDKKYLLETRLTKLVIENGCTSFGEFYQKLISDSGAAVRDKIVDAITTNETLWFRDGSPWIVLSDLLIPEFAEAAKADPGSTFRFWSAAASTGQEAYSLAMLLNEHRSANPQTYLKSGRCEIVGTDISTSALFIAMAGRYDRISMNRGFQNRWASFKDKYFAKSGNAFSISPTIKFQVKFKKLNLQDDFRSLGPFDVVMLRNVAIYFSTEFKKDLFERVANVLKPGGVLFLGSSETTLGYTKRFRSDRFQNSVFYRKT